MMHADVLPEKRSVAVKSEGKAYKAVVIVLGIVLVVMGALFAIKSVGAGGAAVPAGGSAAAGSELGPGATYEDSAGDSDSDGQASGFPGDEAI